jgi:hypothetical protein
LTQLFGKEECSLLILLSDGGERETRKITIKLDIQKTNHYIVSTAACESRRLGAFGYKHAS